MLGRSLVAVLVTFGAPHWIHAMDLQPATLGAWDEYVQTTDRRMQDRLNGARPFLWIDESADRGGRLQRGEVIVESVVGRGTKAVPGGLIHHWIGAIFLPAVTIDNLTSVVHDYDAYERMYKPVVVRSRDLGCAAADREFSMTWQRRVLFVNGAIQGRYWSHDAMLDERRGYEITGTTRLQE
ncbi:MAG TPA: hypothetical protein VKT49_21915, partial [Bryobacteraceae bacterium]|nr:hypothetical protein [Bryobacteraceae bacterium]